MALATQSLFPSPARPADHPVRRLMHGVWLQALRRNEIYVVAILLGVYFLGALSARIVGIDSVQTARFIAALGLELGSMLSAMLVIVMGARQIPQELEQRTIYPVLAKPVTRAQVLIGKALPTWLLGMGAMAMFAAVTLAAAPHQPFQSPLVLFQALLCKAAALAMLVAMTGWLSLHLPASLTMLLAAASAFLGAIAINWLAGFQGIAFAAGFLPDFKLLEQFSRFVDGGAPMSALSLGGVLLYAAAWTAIFSGAALFEFRRRPL